MAPRRRPTLASIILTPPKIELPTTKPPRTPSTRHIVKAKNTGPALKNPLQLVTLYAGVKPKAKSVVVHKDFACHYSPVLKAAFNSNFVEGQTQEYRVDEEDEEVIRLLVHWFYTQQLDVAQGSADSQDDKSDVAGKEELCLVKLWVLADKLLIPQLQNMTLDVLDKLRLKSKAGMESKCLAYVCANTSKDSGCVAGSFIAALSASNRALSWNILSVIHSKCFWRLLRSSLRGPRASIGQRLRQKTTRLRFPSNSWPCMDHHTFLMMNKV